MADGSGYAGPDKRIVQMIEEAEACFNARQPWLTKWQENSDYIIPGLSDYTTTRSPAERRMTKVYDPTQIVANEMLAAGLHGEVTNPTMKWLHKIEIVDRDEQVVEDEELLVHGEAVRDKVLDEFYLPFADFTTNAHELYLTIPAIATASMFTGWNREQNCLSFQCRHMSEIAIKEGPNGTAETVYRRSNWTIEQAAAKFPGKLAPETQKKLEDPKRAQEKIQILHVVTPRRTRNYASMRPDQKAVESTYIEVEQKHKIEEAGFDENPYAVSRWGKIPGEIYGNRSPGWNSLPDIKQLQLVDRDSTTYFQMMAQPHLMAPDDGFVGPYRLRPNGVSYYRAENQSDQYKWFEPGGDPNAFVKWQEARRDRIRQGFYLDLFDFQPQGQPLTATEVNIRQERRLRLLGPLYGRLQSEFLAPVVLRALGLLQRAYRLPVPPRRFIELGLKYRPKFISPQQLAMKVADLQPLYRALELEQGIETAHPGTADIIDWDATKRWAYQTAGMPAKLFLTRAQVQAAQQQKAAMEQATATANTANVGSQAALNVAKTRQTVAETEAGVM